MIEENITEEELLRPDYHYSLSEVEEYGFSKGTMFPLSKARAQTLFLLKLPVFLLYSDNKEEKATSERDIVEHKGMLGIEKEAWEDFIYTLKGKSFLYAWYEVLSITQHLRIKEEIHYGKFSDLYFEELYWVESWCIEVFNENREEPDEELYSIIKSKAYNIEMIGNVIFEYAELLYIALSDAGHSEAKADIYASKILRELTDREYARKEQGDE